MAENFNPITGLNGGDNMGGCKNFVCWVPANAVSSVPVIADIQAADADYVTAVGSFVFKDTVAGKPILIECTDGTVKYSAPSQGEIEGQSFAVQGEFFRAGAKAEYAALARKYNNTPGYLVLEEMNGKQIIVGQPGLPCNLKFEFDSGQKRADRRGLKVSFAADSVCPYIFLETNIDMQALLT